MLRKAAMRIQNAKLAVAFVTWHTNTCEGKQRRAFLKKVGGSNVIRLLSPACCKPLGAYCGFLQF
jgi:hypothetical protein